MKRNTDYLRNKDARRQAMSSEAQRTAIAEACGWKDCRLSDMWGYSSFDKLSANGQSIPDYLSDLNAMHEAEKVLTHQQHFRFATNLFKIVRPNILNSKIRNEEVDPLVISASASQRAEAFLRTLNLWKGNTDATGLN